MERPIRSPKEGIEQITDQDKKKAKRILKGDGVVVRPDEVVQGRM
jgi:hypothetical protein